MKRAQTWNTVHGRGICYRRGVLIKAESCRNDSLGPWVKEVKYC